MTKSKIVYSLYQHSRWNVSHIHWESLPDSKLVVKTYLVTAVSVCTSKHCAQALYNIKLLADSGCEAVCYIVLDMWTCWKAPLYHLQ